MKILILAGGFATRLWPLTEKTAKPLLKIGGVPIASFLVRNFPDDAEIVISTNAVFSEDFEQWKCEFPAKNIEIFVEDADGETSKKGALAAVSLVISAKKWDDDFFVFAGDNLFCFDFSQFFSAARTNPLLAAFDIRDRESAKKFGVVVGKNGIVQKFEEKPEKPKSTLVSTGALFFPRVFLSDIVEFSKRENDNLGGIFEHFLRQGISVEYFEFSEKWFDIGSFPAFLEAQTEIIGKKLVDNGAQKTGKNEFQGFVFLEKNSHLHNVFLENVVVEAGARIKDATIRNSVIGENAVISGVDLSGVALRRESVIGNEDSHLLLF